MFDIGFWELTVIAVVALLVIGPERLPAVARTAGVWVGRARRFVATVKADVDRELKAEELKRVLQEQASIGKDIHEIIEDTKSSVAEIEHHAADAETAGKPATNSAKPAAEERNDQGK